MCGVFHPSFFLINNQSQLFFIFVCINLNHGQVRQDTKLSIYKKI